MKIRLVGAELFHAVGRTDRQTDMTKIIAAFRNCANALKFKDGTLVILKPVGLICISLCEIQITDPSNERLSMKHVKCRFTIRLKFAAATRVIKLITQFVQKKFMIYPDCSQYFNL